MAHFTGIDKNNIVQVVHVIDNENLLNEDGVEEEDFGIAYLNNLFGVEFTWIQTSYNNKFRKQYAGVGFTYDKANDVFVRPQPFESWALNSEQRFVHVPSSWTLDSNHDWQPPTAMPDDGKKYGWNEDTQTWDEQ